MIERLTLGSFGRAKSLKTTMALTAPTPFINFDFDLSWDRPAARFEKEHPGMKIRLVKPNEQLDQSILESFDVIIRQYKLPMNLGTVAGRQIEGIDNLWSNIIIPEYIMAMENPHIASIIIDTGTIFWNLDFNSELERKDKSSDKGRTRLSQIEYARPNMEAQALLAGVRFEDKNLIVTHHTKAKYGDTLKTENGKEFLAKNEIIGDTWDGFRHFDRLSDIIVKNEVNIACVGCPNNKGADWYFDKEYLPELIAHRMHPKLDMNKSIPVCTVEMCGYSLEMQGIKLIKPTFTSILATINNFRMMQGL
jgi:hypothetical protein